ncbi:hypothetical protein DFS34DRAFT_357316 [Phlyctochytrium arcticum]|nr:hypothetical protein DFS34DRAFT_357316 [Phlyctochytrium arcticum]
MGLRPASSSSSRPTVFSTPPNNTAYPSLARLSSRQPSVASSYMHTNPRSDEAFTDQREAQSLPPPIPAPMRRQGSDLSIAYSLGSHYNTPLKEAMASWEEDLASSSGERNSGTLRSNAAQSEAGSTLVEESMRLYPGFPGGAPRALTREDVHNRLLISRTPSRSTREIADAGRFPRLAYPSFLSGASNRTGSAGTVLNDSSIHSNGVIKRGGFASKAAEGDEVEISMPTWSRSLESDHIATMDVDPADEHYPLSDSAPPARKSHRKAWRRLLMAFGIIGGLAIIAALALLILDRTGTLKLSIVKSKISAAAQSVGSWFSRNFSPAVTPAGVGVVVGGSAFIVCACVTLGVVILRRRQKQQEGSLPPTLPSGRRKKSLASERAVAEPHPPQGNLSSSPSVNSLGLIHYNCDYLLPTAVAGETPPDPATPAAAEPSMLPFSPTDAAAMDHLPEKGGHGSRGGSSHDRYKGGGGNVVQVLPPEAVVRRIPTLTQSGAELTLKVLEGRRKAS